MRERWVVAELAIFVARDVVNLPDRGKHFRLLHGVHAEIGFEVEIQIQHIFGIAGLLYRQCQDALFDCVLRLDGRCGGNRYSRHRRGYHRRCRIRNGGGWSSWCHSCRNRRSGGEIGALVVYEADDVGEGGIIAELAIFVARNVVDFADGGEHLGLLDRVDAEIGFEVEIEIEHVGRVAGFLHD